MVECEQRIALKAVGVRTVFDQNSISGESLMNVYPNILTTQIKTLCTQATIMNMFVPMC